MIAPATRPSTGAAARVVPRFWAEIAFWIDGEPGRAVMVKVPAPRPMAAPSSRFGIFARCTSTSAQRVGGEDHDEHVDAAVGEQGGGEGDDHQGTAGPQPVGEGVGDGRRRARLAHDAPEHRARKEKEKVLPGETEHGSGVVVAECRRDGEAVGDGDHQRAHDRGDEDVGPAQGEDDQEREPEQDAYGFHACLPSGRDLASHQLPPAIHVAWRSSTDLAEPARMPDPGADRIAEERGIPLLRCRRAARPADRRRSDRRWPRSAPRQRSWCRRAPGRRAGAAPRSRRPGCPT